MEGCIFCRIVAGNARSWTVYEDEHVKAFLDINPVNAGHTLVIPRRHYRDIYDIPIEELKHIMHGVKIIVQALKKGLGVEAVNIHHSTGKAAGQEIYHFHIHIVPRFIGDGLKISYIPKTELRDEFDDIQRKIIDAVEKA